MGITANEPAAGSGLSRRGLLTGAAGAVALAALGGRPATAAPLPPGPDALGDALAALGDGVPPTVAGTVQLAPAATTGARALIAGEPVAVSVALRLTTPVSAVALQLPDDVEHAWIRGGGPEGSTGWLQLHRAHDGPDGAGATELTDLAWVRAIDELEVAVPDGADPGQVGVHLSDTLGLAAVAEAGEDAVAALLASLRAEQVRASDPVDGAAAAAAGGVLAWGESWVEEGPGVVTRTAERWREYLTGKVGDLLPGDPDGPPSAPRPGARPAIVRRSEWGARAPRSRHSTAPPRAAVLHHTVTRNDYAPSESPAIVRAIQHHHQATNGWSDVGYNLLIDRYGRVFEGRAGGVEAGVVGAHARGYNTGTVGFAVMGDHDRASVPQAAVDAAAQVLAWQARVHGIDLRDGAQASVGGRRIPTFCGHRQLGSSACPGRHLADRMGEIRRRARG